MPVLSNAKHERFAQELAQGKTAFEAHGLAGYKADDGNASKLAARPDVQARVQEITGAAAEKVGVDVQRVLDELSKIAFSNMLDYMRVDAEGMAYCDFSELTRDQAAAIQELVVETRPDPLAPPEDVDDEQEPQGHGGSLRRRRARGETPGREILKVRFKLADKRAALVDLGKHLGLFKQKVEVDVTDPLKKLLEQVSGTAFRPVDGGK